MRSGYPWEETDGYLNTLFQTSNWIPLLSQFPLMHDPGTQFGYSNLTAHVMGIIISRSSKETLLAFAKEYLFDEMEITVPYWPTDPSGYYYATGDIHLTPRNLAKFGQLYLNRGTWNNIQLIPSEWVDESLSVYFLPHMDIIYLPVSGIFSMVTCGGPGPPEVIRYGMPGDTVAR